MNKENRRNFFKAALVSAAGVAALPASANVSSNNVPPTVSNRETLQDIATGSLFWHDKKLFVKLSSTEIDQVYPAIATYA